MSSNPLNGLFLEQRCDNALKTCDFTSSTGKDCASEFCEGFPGTSGTCPQIGLDPQNCCGSSDPASCLNDWVHNGGGATPNVCASVVSIIIECSSADPALFPSSSIYTSGPQATSLAGCMCYDMDGTYDPELDQFASECVASGSAAHPTYYKYGTLLNDFCTNNASPAAAPATTTASGAVGSSAATSETPSSAAAVTTTSSLVAQTTNTTPGSMKSSQQAAATVTSDLASGSTSEAATTSSAKLSSASRASATTASTTTTSSSGSSIKKSLPACSVFLLLGLSMLFRSL